MQHDTQLGAFFFNNTAFTCSHAPRLGSAGLKGQRTITSPLATASPIGRSALPPGPDGDGSSDGDAPPRARRHSKAPGQCGHPARSGASHHDRSRRDTAGAPAAAAAAAAAAASAATVGNSTAAAAVGAGVGAGAGAAAAAAAASSPNGSFASSRPRECAAATAAATASPGLSAGAAAPAASAAAAREGSLRRTGVGTVRSGVGSGRARIAATAPTAGFVVVRTLLWSAARSSSSSMSCRLRSMSLK